MGARTDLGCAGGGLGVSLGVSMAAIGEDDEPDAGGCLGRGGDLARLDMGWGEIASLAMGGLRGSNKADLWTCSDSWCRPKLPGERSPC